MTGRVHPPSPTRWRKAAARSVASHAISAYFISLPMSGRLPTVLPAFCSVAVRERRPVPLRCTRFFLSRIGLIVNDSPMAKICSTSPSLADPALLSWGATAELYQKAAPVNGSALFVRLHLSRVWTAPVLARGNVRPALAPSVPAGAGASYGADAPAPTPPPPARLLPEHPAFRPVPRMRGPSAPEPARHDARRNALQRQAPPSVSAKAEGYGPARRAAAPHGCGRQARPPVPRIEGEILADQRQTARGAARPPAALLHRRARIPKPPARSDPEAADGALLLPGSSYRQERNAKDVLRRCLPAEYG